MDIQCPGFRVKLGMTEVFQSLQFRVENKPESRGSVVLTVFRRFNPGPRIKSEVTMSGKDRSKRQDLVLLIEENLMQKVL